MIRAAAFLQNAWSEVYAGRVWPRRSWLRALHKSRSGQRLRVLTCRCPGVRFWFENTTRAVGSHPDSVEEAGPTRPRSTSGTWPTGSRPRPLATTRGSPR